ncbi:hypothetical protein pb186bvf_007904 [Paramecium bursaria]
MTTLFQKNTRIQQMQKLYRQICEYQNKQMNNAIKSGINENDITIILEYLQQDDPETLSQLLRDGKFKCITVKGIQRLRHKLTPEILKMVTKNYNLELITINIINVKLSQEMTDMLAQGITNVQYLKELKLSQCSLTANLFGRLQSSLMQNSSIVNLDLSKNQLCGPFGLLLLGILQEHYERRQNLEWVYHSRGESPEEDVSQNGICELNLSHNKLTDQFIKDLTPFLQKDRWIKEIQLNHNQIQRDGVEYVNKILEVNYSLIVLDLTNNMGITKGLQEQIQLKLLRNQQQPKQQDKQVDILVNVSDIPDNQHVSYDQESPGVSFGVFDNPIRSSIQQKKKQYECSQCMKLSDTVRKQQLYIKGLEKTILKLKQRAKHNFSQTSQSLLHPQSSMNYLLEHHQVNEQDEELEGIENMMNDLTRMMDNIDAQGSATQNLTAHLSSTILGMNNVTRVMYERDDRNQEQQQEQLMNILGQNSISHNSDT